MRLLPKREYDFVESILKSNTEFAILADPYDRALSEIVEFFDTPIYREFLQLFYFERYKYINRYRDNRSMLSYLCDLLFVQEPTLYLVRREIVYKSAMIFYKYGIL